ncbi:MAG: V-type ATP synthase subunit A, partial [Alkalispirochaeta sp.]
MTNGTVVAINGNMVSVAVDGDVSMNEVGYIKVDDKQLKSEVIRVRGDQVELQVFEDTKGIAIGDVCEFTSEMLAVELGPGLLSTVCDGLQNPLPELAEQSGFFLQRGLYLKALDRVRKWKFTPTVNVGDTVEAADQLGTVPEGI